MADTLKRRTRNPLVATLGPDDPEALLGAADFEPRRRPPTLVSVFEGVTGLQPVWQETGEVALATQVRVAAKKQRERGNGQKNVVEGHAGHLRNDPIEFSKQLSLWVSGTGWRSYNEYIGGRVFYEGYSEDCIRHILTSRQVTSRVRHLTEKRLDELDLPEGPARDQMRAQIEEELLKRTRKMANGLVAKMDSAMVNNLLVRLYRQGIEISISEYARFTAVAQHAASKRQSPLILPCHKSHIDYLTISWLFFRLGLSLPHIVAGENLNMPIVGPMLAKCGAFFIRRTFGDDPLHSTVVKEYIEQLLENGKNIECFIEGSRSRTGKLLPPKLGILKYVLEAVESGRTDDVWLCPVSLQYDKVIENESYVNELLGNPKEKETLSGLLLNTRVIQLQLGRVDVRFQKPFSLRGWLDEQKERRTQPTVRSQKSNQATLLKALGYEILSGINGAAIIMQAPLTGSPPRAVLTVLASLIRRPTGLIGTVLLTHRGRGIGQSELISRVLWLRQAIEARGGQVADWGEMGVEAVVERALDVLKDLVSRQQDVIEETFFPTSRFELSFYRNQVIHLFVEESMLCSVLYSRVKAGGAAFSQRMKRAEALSELHFVSRLLANEFVYSPEGLESNAERTIASLAADEVILVEGEMPGLSPKEREGGRNNFDFFCFLIWPFIETYWLAAVSLFVLTPTSAPPSSNGSVAWFAEKAFQASDVSYLEAVNQATLINAFQRLVDAGVLLTRRTRLPPASTSVAGVEGKAKKAPSVPLMALHPDWNRRDNKTVSNRVFAHCSAIAPQVVEYTAFTYDVGPASDFWQENRVRTQRAAL
ncbi:hypothetical protein JCM10213v2_004865 [Rhodosporidiobolus nylandii]